MGVTAERAAELGERLAAVRERIDSARADAGRGGSDVRLVVVTKFHPFEDTLQLARLGATDLGENRVQEAQAKAERWDEIAGASNDENVGQGAPRRPNLVMIGHIQSKKTGSVARWADEVQSVDSVKVAEGLARGRAREIDENGAEPLRCLVQLSLDGDTSRGGVASGDLLEVCATVAGADSLRFGGIMVVPPLDGGDPAAHFASAASIRERVLAEFPDAVEFSAGMTGDLEEAISAGSTCVRVGTAIMGPRPIL